MFVMNRVSELAASTLLLPEEHQKQTDNRDIDVHHTPSVPKTQPATEVSLCIIYLNNLFYILFHFKLIKINNYFNHNVIIYILICLMIF